MFQNHLAHKVITSPYQHWCNVMMLQCWVPTGYMPTFLDSLWSILFIHHTLDVLSIMAIYMFHVLVLLWHELKGLCSVATYNYKTHSGIVKRTATCRSLFSALGLLLALIHSTLLSIKSFHFYLVFCLCWISIPVGIVVL